MSASTLPRRQGFTAGVAAAHGQPAPDVTPRSTAGTTKALSLTGLLGVVVVRSGFLVVLRDGRERLAAGTSDAALVGSAIHSCVVHGVALGQGWSAACGPRGLRGFLWWDRGVWFRRCGVRCVRCR
jgi:hypothetical protein